MKIRDIASLFNGTILGDPETEISGLAGIETARAGELTYLSTPAYAKLLKTSEAACVIVREPLTDCGPMQVVAENPQYAFARAMELFFPSKLKSYLPHRRSHHRSRHPG